MKVKGTNVESMLQQASQFRKAYVKACGRSLRTHGFSPSEIEILVFLSNNKHSNTAKELAFYLHQSKALICRSVESLKIRGLITIVEDTKDRRIHHLLLHKDSDGVIESIQQEQKEFATWITKDIEEAEWKQMLQVLNRINQNIEQVLGGNMECKKMK